MILFTASDQSYAESVLAIIDPMKSYFKFRLFRNNCYKMTTENGVMYVKDLRIIRNVPLSQMIIIDNSVLSFAFQLDNGIPILPFYNNKDDIEMNFLKTYLIDLNKHENFIEKNAETFKLKQLLTEAINENKDDKEEGGQSPDVSQNNIDKGENTQNSDKPQVQLGQSLSTANPSNNDNTSNNKQATNKPNKDSKDTPKQAKSRKDTSTINKTVDKEKDKDGKESTPMRETKRKKSTMQTHFNKVMNDVRNKK